ncbi:precorrin-6A reductase [Bacillus sp. AGMB 02131]|uniref:Precorrin-6A reductase n=1 Tax=Peribacillus faecalis TaxID=2772559 RepID=A0A927CUC3_9BACI|nr:precorrin-6A reductase [Peribacillus faecalis]MBD3107728.1 precorrin-6A reductase [Peribacillus faecalis]
MILVIGGNKESLDICKFLNEQSYAFIMIPIKSGESVTFQFASHIVQPPINEEDWMHLYEKQGISLVIDASYPFASTISKYALDTCKKMHIPCVRYEHDSHNQEESIDIVQSIQRACELAEPLGERIFLTASSKNLQEYMERLPDKHIIANVLPVSEIIHYCESIGLFAEQIVALKGPFSKELNKELFKWAKADVVITSDSDKLEDIDEKIEACKELDIPCIIVQAPHATYPEKVSSMKELEEYLNDIA